MEQIKLYRSRPFTIIDENFGEMMNLAVRYSLGRRSYAVHDTCSYVASVMPYLDYNTLCRMKHDIEVHDKYDRFGDECDKAEWLNLKEDIAKQIERMVEEAL